MKVTRFSGEFRFLSNFHPARVEFEGVVYPTVEHAYQAAKTLSIEERKRVYGLASPGEAKKLGRRISRRPDWEEVKLSIMADLIRKKFESPTLANLLRDTGDAELIEGNNWGDTFWGRCMGVGSNHLGKILMKVRGEIRDRGRP